MGKRAAGGPQVPFKMREVLVDIAKRLGEIPTLSGGLVKRRAEVSDALHKSLDSMKDREVQVAGAVAAEKNGDGKPAFPNEQARQAEIARRLAADPGYTFTRAEADLRRAELKELDAEIEQVGRRHRSDSNVAYLVASLLGAGLKEDAEAVLTAYAEGTGKTVEHDSHAEAPAKPAAPETPAPSGGDDLETGVFKVLEARPGKSDGTIRAYVEGPEGKVALYAKNGAGKTLAASVGRTVEAKYRHLDKGLYAVSLRPVT
ncbi:MAG: hypothetical protein QHH75_04900 [Bacillota bacterium]|nr:hypothetical protein [Bacillota bacterium]